jgi:ATP-dependent Lhr-like helicase
MPSPLALEILPLVPMPSDDAPLEERTQAVVSRRWLDPESAADRPPRSRAIERVNRGLAEADSADELHDALLWMGYVTWKRRANAGGRASWLNWPWHGARRS